MKKGISGVLTIGFLLAALLFLGVFNWSKPRILVMHSFDPDAPSVKKMNEGIRRTLGKNRQPVSVRWHYLSMDRLPEEETRQDSAAEGRRAIEQFDPDVIIAVDDETQEYVARHYAGHSRPAVIFTAIDRDPKEYGYVGAPNVTGIIETLPLDAVRDTLLQARQGKPARLAILGHPGPTGTGRLHQVESFNWAPHRVVAVNMLRDFASWQIAIAGMENKADVILLLSDDGLQVSATNPTLVPRADITHWINDNAKPLPLGFSASYVEEGGGISILPSPVEMGELAADYALSWLKTRSVNQLPITRSSSYRVAIPAAALDARSISLPSIYVEAARMDQLYFP